MKNIVVLVSGGGTNLQALLDAEGRGEMPHVDLTLVVSNNEKAYALKRAQEAGVEGVFIKNDGDFETRLTELLAERGIDMIILAGFMRILSADFIKDFEGRIINIHPSLIPSFCGKGFYGLRVHEAALARGVKLTGATVHIVTAEADAGPILMQKAVEVLEGDTPEILQKRVMREAEWVMLPRAAELLAAQL